MLRAKAALYQRVWRDLKGAALPLRVGFAGTGLWAVLIVIYIVTGNRWDAFWKLTLDNMGDFLGGAFAPLAFLWLVVAVLLQTAELGLQRDELRQSREALEQQAAETRSLVQANKLSVDVATKTLEQQEMRAREDRMHRVIDALAFKIMNLAGHSHVIVNGNRSEPFSNQRILRKQAEEDGSRDAIFPFVLKQLVNWLFYVSGQKQQPPTIVPSPTLTEDVQLLLTKFQELNTIIASEPGLETVRMRIYALDLEAYVDALQDVLSVLGKAKQA